MTIDEASPSEDEREALRVIRGGNAPVPIPANDADQGQDFNNGNNGEDNAYDVLQDHHRRNRPNRPPQLARLRAATTEQNLDNEENSEQSDAPSQKRAPRKAKEYNNVDPETLSYYPETWKIVLTRAKVKYRRHIFLNQAFPKRGHDLITAREILIETIAECEEDGDVLDNSKYYPFQFSLTEQFFV